MLDSLILTRNKLTYLGLWLIIPFCSLAIHKGVPVPPTLVLFLGGTFFLFITIGIRHVDQVICLPVFVISYILISQIFIGAPFNRFMGTLFAIAYFPVILIFIKRLRFTQIEKLSTLFIKVTVLLLIAECVWRITHPNLDYLQFEDAGDVRWIYLYKFSSFMYSESNATAIHIVIVLFYIFYLEYEHDQTFTKSKWILIGLLILTFSRAGCLGAILGWAYIRFLQKKSVLFYFLNLILLSIISILIYQFYLRELIENDLSFQSKFEIVNHAINYFKSATWSEWLFGIGFSNSISRLGIYAHNFFIVFLIESGVVGFILMILLMIHFVLITRRKALFVMVPFLVTTLSSTITFMPFFYVSMALIYFMESNRKSFEFKRNQ